jgi:pimeloyl-ACP methyl ester carboxylesterase
MSELTPFLIGAKIQQPTLFVAGDIDAVVLMYGEQIKTLEQNIPNLKKKVMIPGAGHWIQQERPSEVNELLVEFLKGL